jgi:hypothetical protein
MLGPPLANPSFAIRRSMGNFSKRSAGKTTWMPWASTACAIAASQPLRTLLGGLNHKGFSLDLVIVSDGAGQFAILLHALCWVHAERLVHQLIPLNDRQRQDQQRAGAPAARHPAARRGQRKRHLRLRQMAQGQRRHAQRTRQAMPRYLRQSEEKIPQFPLPFYRSSASKL